MTDSSSPFVPGARPSNSSDDSTLRVREQHDAISIVRQLADRHVLRRYDGAAAAGSARLRLGRSGAVAARRTTASTRRRRARASFHDAFQFISRAPIRSSVASAMHLRRVHDVVDAALLVRLMRQLELARPVGDAVRHAGDARDVLVIVGAGAGDELGAAGRGRCRSDCSSARDHRRVVRRARRVDDHQIAQVEADAGRRRRGARRPARRSPCLVASKPSSIRNRRSNTARQRSATHGVWMPSDRLAAFDAVDVDRRVARARRHDRHRGACATRAPASAPRAPSCSSRAHAVDRADAEKRHAAVRRCGRAPSLRTSRRRDGRCRCGRR